MGFNSVFKGLMEPVSTARIILWLSKKKKLRDLGKSDTSARTGFVFYVLLTVLIGIIFANKEIYASSFSCMFISILYMFRAAMCPSSGELIVSIRHLVYVGVYR